MKAALVIMAAGLGSRYGGNKQVDGVGPNGEILMEYSIYDAIRAGVTKIVFVIKPGMEEMMRRICGDYVARRTAADGSVGRCAMRCRISRACRRFITCRRSGKGPLAQDMRCCAPGPM